MIDINKSLFTPTKRISDQQIIVAAKNPNMTGGDIARKFGMSTSYANTRLRLLGLNRQPVDNDEMDEEEQHVIEDRNTNFRRSGFRPQVDIVKLDVVSNEAYTTTYDLRLVTNQQLTKGQLEQIIAVGAAVLHRRHKKKIKG